MNAYTIIVISILTVIFLINELANFVNIRNMTTEIPKEFEGYFDKEKYEKSQKYLISNTKFSSVSAAFFLIIQIVLIISGGFNYINNLALSASGSSILAGLIFAGIVLLIFEILKIPFSVYRIFIIEEKFGFNRMSFFTFISDLLKSWIIGAAIGAIVFSGLIWFFINAEQYAWLYAFGAIVAFELFIIFIAPVAIMPLFNKYTPLEDGELRKSVEQYAKKENFKMKGLFKMDGSKRSSKSNAFFTGFGRFRKIVLFDTLIQNHTVDELTSILAHEMGHFKLGHIIKNILFSFISTGIMLFLLSLFINKSWLYSAFLMEHQTIYAGIIFFGLLYSPISFILSIIQNYFSRKHEYEADAYAAKTYEKPFDMINALKKLSADNLSNLTPHKFKVFLDYSHPPILERIKALKMGRLA
jgi:STE24 endopeptidase